MSMSRDRKTSTGIRKARRERRSKKTIERREAVYMEIQEYPIEFREMRVATRWCQPQKEHAFFFFFSQLINFHNISQNVRHQGTKFERHRFTAHGQALWAAGTTNEIILKATWNFYQYFMADLSVCSEACWRKIGHRAGDWGERKILRCVRWHFEHVSNTRVSIRIASTPRSFVPYCIRIHNTVILRPIVRMPHTLHGPARIHIPFVHNLKYKMENQNIVLALFAHCALCVHCARAHARILLTILNHFPRKRGRALARSLARPTISQQFPQILAYYYKKAYYILYFSFVFCFRTGTGTGIKQ